MCSDDDEEDETAALMRELEKIKKERAEAKAKEERERAAEEEEQREIDVARGNPLLNKADFTMKRRWDDDVVFKNQARGTEDRNKKKEFINDMLRSDFHKKFMVSLPVFLILCMLLTQFQSPNMYDEPTFEDVPCISRRIIGSGVRSFSSFHLGT